MKPAANAKANVQTQESDLRPTITIARVMLNGPDTTAFSGWGPKVSGVGNILKNWN
ncbi:MAG TPA: hypothetical protein VGZ02_01365 [Candidatus Baltobacteraceae bacterium]|nr:hypothetical protein [Candidatus Baltobacteraceae bacterium]